MNEQERTALTLLGMRIRVARIKRLETQQQVADRAGISRSALSYIEKGDIPPGLLTLWRIADALELPIAELVERP